MCIPQFICEKQNYCSRKFVVASISLYLYWLCYVYSFLCHSRSYNCLCARRTVKTIFNGLYELGLAHRANFTTPAKPPREAFSRAIFRLVIMKLKPRSNQNSKLQLKFHRSFGYFIYFDLCIRY